MNINKGDVIKLKSGGPPMTVTGVIGEDPHLDILKKRGFSDGDVTVQYFIKNKLEKGSFRSSSVEIFEK